MSAMQYYVGSWSCVAHLQSVPTLKYTAVNRIDSGILREWVTIPAQSGMPSPEGFSMVMSYNPEKRQFVQSQVHFDGMWSVSVAKPWNGNTERWTDVATDSGKFGHAEYVRIGRNAFSFTAYPHWSTASPINGMCNRTT